MATRSLSQKEQDIQMMLAADVHLGTKNCDFQMERYVFKRRSDGNTKPNQNFSSYLEVLFNLSKMEQLDWSEKNWFMLLFILWERWIGLCENSLANSQSDW